MTNSSCPRFRPGVEPLEGREVPASYTASTVPELIAVINTANQTAEADTITLTPGKTFTLTEANNAQYPSGPNGLPVVAAAGGPLIVLGSGDVVERSTAAGTPDFRLFEVAAGASLTLQNLTLQGGLVYGYPARGGAVLNWGALTLGGVTVQNNTARGIDGFYFYSGNVAGGRAEGGGVYSAGTLTMDNCAILNNAAVGGRGADGGGNNKDHPHLHWIGYINPPPPPPGASDGGDAFGGGLYVAAGTATITNTSITQNSAQAGDGGQGGGAKNGKGVGGGVYIAPDATVGLDAFTVANVKKNQSSSGDHDISGPYVGI